MIQDLRDPYIRNAADEIDSAIFSGDAFIDPAARATLREILARWERGLKEFDNLPGDDEHTH